MNAPERRARGFRGGVSRSTPVADPDVAAAALHRSRTAHRPSLGRGIVWSEFLRHIEEEWAAVDAAREAASGVRRRDRPAPGATDEQAGAAA